MVDLSSIRRAAQEGWPIMPGQVIALINTVERQERELIYERTEVMRAWAESMGWEDEALASRPVIAAARAWAGAIERQDVGEIERCEGELIVAIVACS